MKNIPAFPLTTSSGACINEGITLLDYFAVHLPEPSRESIDREIARDKNNNPYNEPSKPRLRSVQEIVVQLRYSQAAEMLKARNTYH